ncbi:winged helix-turn-helix domain-containing protein [Pseudocitrobacter cyperus]|uniref:Winged helix-turn-helix domain-containing protein n=1 Tax=Pseudocitrobacter cyperus TaxID=3112843 RepID=A0ABV0HN67_9ENTR
MINNIAIGSLITLDLQTRVLARTDNEASVTLPQSACLCLAALIDAGGEVLSQEQLMDIGWRSAGVEVTDNSVRVMITKLRRAFVQLDMQDAITLLAVTRSGYRLIVRDADSDPLPAPTVPPTAPPEAEERPTPAEEITPPARPHSKIAPRILITLGGLLTGIALAMVLRSVFDLSPQPINFVRWDGPGIPPNTVVMVQTDKQEQRALIESTLQTYTQHVLAKRPSEKPAGVLYVTTGSEKMSKFQGLIACQQLFKDSGNDCESFYFRHY